MRIRPIMAGWLTFGAMLATATLGSLAASSVHADSARRVDKGLEPYGLQTASQECLIEQAYEARQQPNGTVTVWLPGGQVISVSGDSQDVIVWESPCSPIGLTFPVEIVEEP